MNPASKNPLLRSIFEQAAGELPALREPNVPHLVDNDDLLTRWTLDQLRPDEHARIVEHLSLCGSCRREVATLVKQGVLELPRSQEVDEPTLKFVPATNDVASGRSSSRRRQRFGWAVAILATAATVVIAGVVGILYPRWRSETELARIDSQLGRAEAELQDGEADAARDRVARLLDWKIKDPDRRERAANLFEKACVAQAKKKLANGEFDEVAEIDQAASDRGINSAQLQSLKIQSDRQMTVQVALAHRGSLLDYGYMLDGSAPGKAIPVPDARTERVDRAFTAALEQHPSNLDLLLNRGQFLLDRGKYQDANEAFLAALRLDEHSILALLGLGLAHYQLNQFKSALDRFEEVLQRDPDNVLAHLNLGICLQHLERSNEARPHFESAGSHTEDPALRGRLERFLNRTK